MSDNVLMFKQIHTNVLECYRRADKQGVAGTHLPRGNFSDVCNVLSGLMLIDIMKNIDVELTVHGVDLHLLFSIKGDDDE